MRISDWIQTCALPICVACGAGPEQELATVGEAREAADAPETARIRSALAASSDRQKSPGSLADGYARAIIRNADRACIMVDADIYPASASRSVEPSCLDGIG